MANLTVDADLLARLAVAIDTTSKERLGNVLKVLARKSDSTARDMADLLLVRSETVRKNKEDYDTSPNNDASVSTPAAGQKRLRPRYTTCEQCHKEYDVTDNNDDSCVWHPDDPEPDDDFWVDHDENCHGPIDTEENFEEYPEGFIYQCCDEDGTDPGCMVTMHRESTARRIRRKKLKQ